MLKKYMNVKFNVAIINNNALNLFLQK